MEPGERRACVARLNWLLLKSFPPTITRTRPVPGSIVTMTPSVSKGAFWRTTAWALRCQSRLMLVRTLRPPTSSCSWLTCLGSSWATQLVKNGAALLKYFGSAGRRFNGALLAAVASLRLMNPSCVIRSSTTERRWRARSGFTNGE